MHADFDRRLRQPRELRRLDHRKPVQLHMHDGQALAVGQCLQQLTQIASCLSGFGIAAGEQLVGIVQRIVARF